MATNLAATSHHTCHRTAPCCHVLEQLQLAGPLALLVICRLAQVGQQVGQFLQRDTRSSKAIASSLHLHHQQSAAAEEQDLPPI